jgi:hypothetical protein
MRALYGMPSSLKLEHIGEDLVSSMLRESTDVQQYILGCNLSEMSRVVVELPLGSWCGRIFDGAHRVDVAVVDKEICFPIELKLGLSRMRSKEFSKRFLASISTSHGDRRIKGGMISILDRRWEGREDDVIEIDTANFNTSLSRAWALVIRKEIVKKWMDTEYPPLSSYCKLVVLEDLIDVFGSPNEFNELVKDLVTGDYFNEWFVA